MDPKSTALILVGYQNDYFARDGILRGVVESPGEVDAVLRNTLNLIETARHTALSVIATPIVLAPDYRAMATPVGILNSMKDAGAFKQGTPGAETIPELKAFGDRIDYVQGKVGFNAFDHTSLGDLLERRGVRNVLVAGMVTSLCIDSTGRAAYERGLSVTILSDCCSARTRTEHDFYCKSIFPLYGRAASSTEVLRELLAVAA